MDIQFAILGLLSWKSLSGYDLKKLIAESELFYWSGNNNQIYNNLIQLHQEGLVTQQVQHQESLPAKKIYSLTSQGQAKLHQWALASPELPELHHPFLIQLAWAEVLSDEELEVLLGRYEEEINVQLRMRQAQAGLLAPGRSTRERYLWEKIFENLNAAYQRELDWVRQVRKGLKEKGYETRE